jgi:hypothetical protein
MGCYNEPCMSKTINILVARWMENTLVISRLSSRLIEK